MKTAKFYGNMEWFDVDDDLPDSPPEPLRSARELWLQDPEKNEAQVIEMLLPYLKSYFVPAAIDESGELFPDQADVPANEVKIV